MKLKPFDFVLAVMAAVLVVAALDVSVFNLAWAADPFAKTAAKGNELADALKGKIAIVLTTIVIIVTGIMMLMGRVSHLVGVRILIGALVIGGAGTLAEWAYT